MLSNSAATFDREWNRALAARRYQLTRAFLIQIILSLTVGAAVTALAG